MLTNTLPVPAYRFYVSNIRQNDENILCRCLSGGQKLFV